jgi:NAD(P)-dependent dehydrogenase (short-subunit alcohol dehydrogenase family)
MVSKIWLITGTSSGFGRALCEAALERGDRVFATARNLATIADIAARWPGNAHIAELDVTVGDSIEKGIREAVRIFGRIDVLVNNAGYGLIGSLEECSDAQIRRNFEVNFFGALNVIRAALPQFRAQKSGHVINISAAAAIANYPGFGIYGAAKCALEGISESLVAEGRGFGLKATIVEPGPFRTDFISRSLEHSSTDIEEYHGSVGKFAKFIAGIDGKQPGDPHKAAQQILKVADAERPPVRLVLGKYAVDKARRSLVQRENELKQWEESGLEADGAPT